MPEQKVLEKAELPNGAKKTVKLGETEILLLNHEGTVLALQAKCPHAGAPLEKGAVCNGRLVCPWHMATFTLPGGALVEPPAIEGLKTYPVRVKGEGIFVDSQPVAAPGPLKDASKTDARTFLLVGSGAASTMAAITLRAEGFQGRIVAVDPVEGEPVDRTQLSKQALAGKMPLEKLPLDALKENDVERMVASVESIDGAVKEAVLSDGKTIKFDAALVATGGTPKRLKIPGAEFARTIRHVDDVRKILAAAENARSAVVIGSSFIGLEAASALVQKGLHVTVVGTESLPFARKFGDRVANALVAWHESKGVDFRLEADITQISDSEVSVKPRDGKKQAFTIPAELVILGAGVAPELGFRHGLPLAEKGGIAVSGDLSAADGIWVAGDIASVDGTRIEHWRLAEQHGQVAARQMLGGTEVYEGVPFFWTFHHGKRLGYLGHAEDWDEIVYDGAVDELTFLAYYIKGEKVVAILSCGRDTETAMLAEGMRSKPTLPEARRSLVK